MKAPLVVTVLALAAAAQAQPPQSAAPGVFLDEAGQAHGAWADVARYFRLNERKATLITQMAAVPTRSPVVYTDLAAFADGIDFPLYPAFPGIEKGHLDLKRAGDFSVSDPVGDVWRFERLPSKEPPSYRASVWLQADGHFLRRFRPITDHKAFASLEAITAQEAQGYAADVRERHEAQGNAAVFSIAPQ